jgi:hypothetical protein
MRPPSHIDGALVLEWAWSDTPFGIVPYVGGGTAAVIHGLALCRYEGASVIYRFSCGSTWECEQDGVYDSIEIAKSELPDQYRHAPIHWTIA